MVHAIAVFGLCAFLLYSIRPGETKVSQFDINGGKISQSFNFEVHAQRTQFFSMRVRVVEYTALLPNRDTYPNWETILINVP